VYVGFRLEGRVNIHKRTWEEKQWQTIVKKIRVVASNVEVNREGNRLRAVRAVIRKQAADKTSRADSKEVSRVARVDNKAHKRAGNKATANV
jgi:ABC-type hemin transport system substrate-binding protein